MKKTLFITFLASTLCIRSLAQIMPYGVVDTADLKMTSCDFETDANAEVLFDKGVMKIEAGLSMERHIRIKIFNDFGKRYATIHLPYYSDFFQGKSLAGLEGETINMENGALVKTPVEKAQIFTRQLNKRLYEYVFTFPGVKAGSIIEYKYRSYPNLVWFFQSDLPTRYSEIQAVMTRFGTLNAVIYNRQIITTSETTKPYPAQTRSMANVHSLQNEPYMTARIDNLQCVVFNVGTFLGGFVWSTVVNGLIKTKSFGDQVDASLPGEEAILKKSDVLPTDEARLAFMFDTIRAIMKWNKTRSFLPVDNLSKAWETKSGNTAEINLILFHFIRAIGLNAFAMVLSTRDHGNIDELNPAPYMLNNTVVFVKLNKKAFVLDASNKANQYNTIPFDDLDVNGIAINLSTGKYEFVRLRDTSRVLQTVLLNAEVFAPGRMKGTAELTGDSYNKINALEKYFTDGEQKYVDSLHVSDNNISITSFKMYDMTSDTLPLTQKISFAMDLPGSDGNYIYFNLNSFTYLESNPFKGVDRISNIDLGYRNDYSINGVYKIPSGYKADALPPNITMLMPDHSMIFKRSVTLGDGEIYVRCVIEHGKTFYLAKDYPDLRAFYKKMYDLLNEQIVLKKQ